MKITLIYPGIAQIGFGSFGRGTPTANLMNLGLGYLASSIKQRTGHEVDLIDLRKNSGWEDFRRDLQGRSCDAVGIYTNTVNFEYAMKSAEIARGLGKTVIAGGPHATLDPGEILESGHVDHVVTGEGELTIADLLDDLEKGRGADKIIPGRPVEDLDSLPFPDRDIFDLEGSLELTGFFPFPPRYAGVLASRGCCFNCAFCQPLERKIFGPRIKLRSVENVIREVRMLKERYRAEFIMFQDDQLTQKRSWVLDLCAELKKVGIDWGALARVDTVDGEVVRSMRDAGCLVLQFGFESGSQRILDFLRKKAKVEQAVRAARICRENGVLIFANYMMGIPTETEEDLEMTAALMREIRPEILSPAYFSPIPGSDLYEYCRENDLINVTSYDMYVRGAVDNKLKGVDYALLGRYKRRIEDYAPAWYEEGYYASCVGKRWKGLARAGHLRQAAGEIVARTPFLARPLGLLRKKSGGRPG